MTLNMLGMRLILVAAAIISGTALKVPVEKIEESKNETKAVVITEQSSQKPIYYKANEESVDSYLVPANPDRAAEITSDEIPTPATYLLPPSLDKQSDYYKPTESGEQTDWYPIAPAASPISRGLLPPRQVDVIPILTVVNQSDPILGSFRAGKVIELDRNIGLPVPSRDLQPPLQNAPNEYIAIEPEEATYFPFENQREPRPAGYPLTVWNGQVIAVPNNIRAKPIFQVPYNTRKYKNPTKLYPKKYGSEFKPVPIPLAHFTDESLGAIPKAKPLVQFQPNQMTEDGYVITPEEKKIYKYEEAQKKHKLKGEPEIITVEQPDVSEPQENTTPSEQETSATNYRVPLRHVYRAPLRQAPPLSPVSQAETHKPPADGERTEFRMHGMKGPHSYQFGFDTGKGKNRQFRYEERDNDGHVKGHYGYVDKLGKLRVVNYDADPEHGFRAEAPVESE